MSSEFVLETEKGTLTVSRYAGPVNKIGSRLRYNITDVYGNPALDLTQTNLATLAQWIIAELVATHDE